MLNGKCKLDFEKWYLNVFQNHEFRSEKLDKFRIKIFNSFPNIMKYSVYINFFDVTDIDINIETYLNNRSIFYKVYILGNKNINEQNSFTKRIYAQENSIKLANKIYNDRNNNK